MNNEIRIIQNNKEIVGWKAVQVHRSLDSLAHGFSFHQVPSKNGKIISINEYDPIAIFLGDVRILTGYVDSLSLSRSENGVNYSFQGRTKTSDLIDCSVEMKPTSWKNISLVALIGELIKPYGLSVSIQEGIKVTENFDKFTVELGESVNEAIQRACGLRNIIPTVDAFGNVLLTRVTESDYLHTLQAKHNFTELTQNLEFKLRYSDYTVIGANDSAGSKVSDNDLRSQGTAKDESFGRYRFLCVSHTDRITNASAKSLALWESRIRYGKSINLSVSVPYWTFSDKLIWHPNQIHYIIDKELNIDNTFLLNGVDFIYSEQQGKRSNLHFVDTLAYDLQPEIIKKQPTPKTKKRSNTGGWL